MMIPFMLRRSATTTQKPYDDSTLNKLRKARDNSKIQFVLAVSWFIIITIICFPTIVAIATKTPERAQKKWLLAMGLGVLFDLTIYQFFKVVFHVVLLLILGGNPMTSESKARICIIKVMDRSVLRPFLPRADKASVNPAASVVDSQLKDGISQGKDVNLSINASSMAMNPQTNTLAMNESSVNQSPEKTSPSRPKPKHFILDDSELRDIVGISPEKKEQEQTVEVSEIKLIPDLSVSEIVSNTSNKRIIHKTGEMIYLDNSILPNSNVLNIRSVISEELYPVDENNPANENNQK